MVSYKVLKIIKSTWLFIILSLISSQVYSTDLDAYREEKKKTRQEIADYYYSLATDDDPLTGVWSDITDWAARFYTLYEKENGEYKVRFCSPRYSVGTWPAKVDFVNPIVGIWQYIINKDTISSEKTPSLIYNIKDNDLYRFGEHEYPISSLLTNTEEIIKMSGCTFKTGEESLKVELSRLKENASRTPLHALLESSKTLSAYGRIISFSKMKSVQINFDDYYLYAVTLRGPARSGYCGSSENKGYYWLKVNESKIVDDWLFSINNCRSSDRPWLRTDEKLNIYMFKRNDYGKQISDQRCFKLTEHISKQPIDCSVDDIPVL
jgi:hypothetical protein